jgi:ankyrin repeat protein
LARAAEAVAIKPGTNFDPGDRFTEPQDILNLASSLVSLEETDGDSLNSVDSATTIRLAHASVLDYLESAQISQSAFSMFHMSQDKAHIDLAESCLRYLLYFEEALIDVKADPSWQTTWPLLGYSASHWMYHLSSVPLDSDRDAELCSLGVRVLSSKAFRSIWQAFRDTQTTRIGKGDGRRCFHIWIAFLWTMTLAERFHQDLYYHPLKSRCVVQNLTDPSETLVFAVYRRIPRLFEMLIESGHDPLREESILNQKGLSLLTIALENNDNAMVKSVLMHGISVDKATPCCQTIPLQLALWSKDWELVKILLEAGIDTARKIDVKYTVGKPENWKLYHGPLLPLAHEFSVFDVVQVLKQAKASMNASFMIAQKHKAVTCSSVSWKTAQEDVPAIKCLLQEGTDPNSTIEYFTDVDLGGISMGRVLQLAISTGKIELVKILLLHGVNPNAICHFFTQVPNRTGIEAIKLDDLIRFLKLESAKKPISKDSDDVLSSFEEERWERDDEDDDEHGDDENLEEEDKKDIKEGKNEEGEEDEGEEEDREGKSFTVTFSPTGLWALSGRDPQILRALLKRGSLANFPKKTKIMPPLISNITRARIKGTQILLDHGADLNYDGRFGTPLYHAAHLTDKRLEKILRKVGAEDVATVSHWAGL